MTCKGRTNESWPETCIHNIGRLRCPWIIVSLSWRALSFWKPYEVYTWKKYGAIGEGLSKTINPIALSMSWDVTYPVSFVPRLQLKFILSHWPNLTKDDKHQNCFHSSAEQGPVIGIAGLPGLSLYPKWKPCNIKLWTTSFFEILAKLVTYR